MPNNKPKMSPIDTKAFAERSENRERLGEIISVLRRHGVVRGLTPEKLCSIIEDLGPTFIKLGQILSMRSDILPENYCEALTKLRCNVKPMPYEEVSEILYKAYGKPISEVFSEFDRKALGSASIAQAHKAVLKTGEKVVVKVQRRGIHEVMSRDIILLRHACRLLKYTPIEGLLDFNTLLDEMWNVTEQEMDFLIEADNLEKFHRLNEDVAFATCPTLYRDYTMKNVLVMEYVDGFSSDDKKALTDNGYDLDEIGAKLADNYIKQIMDDGFFHADPHPGNIKIRGGKIVWIDMGMMGVLSPNQRKLISKAIAGIATNDINSCIDAILGLGVYKDPPDKRKLFRDVDSLLIKYVSADLGDMDLSKVFEDIAEIMKANGIAMPSELAMLPRGLATIEGLIADLAPNTNILAILQSRIKHTMLKDFDFKAELIHDMRAVYASAHKALEIPALAADLLRLMLKGDTNFEIEHHVGKDTKELVMNIVRKLCAALLAAALFVCGGLIYNTQPAIGPISVVSLACLIGAILLLVVAFLPGKKKKK